MRIYHISIWRKSHMIFSKTFYTEIWLTFIEITCQNCQKTNKFHRKSMCYMKIKAFTWNLKYWICVWMERNRIEYREVILTNWSYLVIRKKMHTIVINTDNSLNWRSKHHAIKHSYKQGATHSINFTRGDRTDDILLLEKLAILYANIYRY